MAYKLKYWQYVGRDDSRVLIQVYVKGWTGRSYVMAHVSGASLQIVGGNSDVLTSVIKTAFSWSLVDAFDEGTTRGDGTTCVNSRLEKCGQWEEFFTPDATKFKVVVSAAPVGGLARAIWTGFVTPDSWSEDLIYRGSVTITARDMLGALNEMEFDLTGRPSVLQMVQGALSACGCAMPIDYKQAHFLVNSDGYSMLSHNVGAMTYGGETWWTALTDTLESLGLLLRWNGQNQIVLTSLRYLAEDTQAGYHEMQFVNRTGMRELAAALKLVTETFDVQMKDLDVPDPAPAQITPSSQTITQHQTGEMGVTPQRDVTVNSYDITPPSGGGWSGLGCLAVPRPLNLYDDAPVRDMYLVTDVTTTGHSVDTTFSRPGLVPPFSLSVKQEGGVLVYDPSMHSIRPRGDQTTLTAIQLVIMCKRDGDQRYLGENGWSAQFASLTIAPGDEVPVPPLENPSELKIVVRSLSTHNTGFILTGSAFFAVALSLQVLQPREVAYPLEFKTTTEYDQQNNVTITRRPKVASAPTQLSPDFCPNLLCFGSTLAPDEWNWPGEETYYPLAVMVQAQVLCYYSAPASIFTGTAHDGSLALPGWGLRYFGRDCVLVSGTYDFRTGFISQLNAREVYSWEDVWGESFAPEYVVKTATTKGGTDASGRWSDALPTTPSGAFNEDDFSDDFQITRQ